MILLSRFTHLACDVCWNAHHPKKAQDYGYRPVTGTCCYCLLPVTAGAYFRALPVAVTCGGSGGVHNGAHPCGCRPGHDCGLDLDA